MKLPGHPVRTGQARRASREGNFVHIVPLNPAYPALAGRGTCRPHVKIQISNQCRRPNVEEISISDYEHFGIYPFGFHLNFEICYLKFPQGLIRIQKVFFGYLRRHFQFHPSLLRPFGSIHPCPQRFTVQFFCAFGHPRQDSRFNGFC